jgi:beta-glucosidase
MAGGNSYADIDYKPLYPFGFGLSYTTFEYTNLNISPESNGPHGDFKVSFDVRNTGSLSGSEIVQLYLRDKISTVVRPLQELKGFTKIALEPAEIRTIEFAIGPNELKMLDRNMNWIVEPGEFLVMIGSSSEDIRLKGTITIK